MSEEYEDVITGHLGESRAFYISKKGVNHFDIYLSGAIKKPSLYYELLDVFRSLAEYQSANLYINSEGGDAYTTMQIVHAIQECQGNVVAVLDGSIMSAATFLALACHGWVINPFCRIMCHGWSNAHAGKVQEIRSSMAFEEAWLEGFFRQVYKGFLTDKEVDDVLQGKDLWFGSEEAGRRLASFAKYRQSGIAEDVNSPTPEIVAIPNPAASPNKKARKEKSKQA